MADYSIVSEALNRGYSIGEIADRLAVDAGHDPALIRQRGYGDEDILTKLGYSKPVEQDSIGSSLVRGVKNTFDYSRIAATNDPAEIANISSGISARQVEPTEAQKKMTAEFAPYVKEAREADGIVDNVWAYAKGYAKRIAQMAQNPYEFAKMTAENVPNSIPGMVGTVGGAIAGSVGGPGGSIAGGIAGGTSAGYSTEQGSSMFELITKEAINRGVDPKDPKALAPIIQEKYDELLSQSRLKGIGTAATDAVLTRLTFGIGGMGERALAKEGLALADALKAGEITTANASKALIALEAKAAARNAFVPKVSRGAGMVVGEMAGESVSEAVGQKLGYGQVDPGDVIDEGVLSLGQGGAMAVGEKAIRPFIGKEVDPVGNAITDLGKQIHSSQKTVLKAAPEQIADTITNEPTLNRALETASAIIDAPVDTEFADFLKSEQIDAAFRQTAAIQDARKANQIDQIATDTRVADADLQTAISQVNDAPAVPTAMELAFKNAKRKIPPAPIQTTAPTGAVSASTTGESLDTPAQAVQNQPSAPAETTAPVLANGTTKEIPALPGGNGVAVVAVEGQPAQLPKQAAPVSGDALAASVSTVRAATPQEAVASERATPMLDLNKAPTGWKRIPLSNGNGTLLVSADGKQSVEFQSANPKSGTEGLRANAKAQAFAIDNPYSGEIPQGELIATPIFKQPATTPAPNPEPRNANPVAESQARAPEARDAGVAPGQDSAVPETFKPLSKTAAERQAKQFTNQGMPTETIPHPTEAGMWAIRAIEAKAEEKIMGAPVSVVSDATLNGIAKSTGKAAPIAQREKARREAATTLADARLEDAKTRDLIESMPADAGWAEKGGKLIRDTFGNVSGRTTWIPNAPWFSAGMGKQSFIDGAVKKALAGEPMKAAEKRTVLAMIDWAREQTHPQLDKFDTNTLADAGVLDNTEAETQSLEEVLARQTRIEKFDAQYDQYLRAIEDEEIGSPYDTEAEPFRDDGETAGIQHDAGSEGRNKQPDEAAASQSQESGQASPPTDGRPQLDLTGQTEAEARAEQERLKKLASQKGITEEQVRREMVAGMLTLDGGVMPSNAEDKQGQLIGAPTANKFETSDSGNITKMDAIDTIGDLRKLINTADGEVFVRWSNAPEHDLKEGAASRDYVSGETHSGLSAVPVDSSMTDALLASRLHEYGFLRMKDSDLRPRIYIAKSIGKDSDGYDLIRPSKYVGVISDKLISQLDDKNFHELMRHREDLDGIEEYALNGNKPNDAMRQRYLAALSKYNNHARNFGENEREDRLKVNDSAARTAGNKPDIAPPSEGQVVSGNPEFIKAPDGSIDFGEITREQGSAMRRQPGKIRLETGDDSYGLTHIKKRRGKNILAMGFDSVEAFVSDAVKHIDAIWRPSTTSQMVVIQAQEKGKAVFIELKPSEDGDYYTVNTAFPVIDGYAEDKDGWKLLWGGASVPAVSSGDNPFAGKPPSAGATPAMTQGQSSNKSIGESPAAVKPASEMTPAEHLRAAADKLDEASNPKVVSESGKSVATKENASGDLSKVPESARADISEEIDRFEASVSRDNEDLYYQRHSALQSVVERLLRSTGMSNGEARSLKDRILAGSINFEQTDQGKGNAASLPSEAAKEKNARLNMRPTVATADILTPGGALKADAFKGKVAIWFHQGDPNHIQFRAKVTFSGEPAPVDAITEWDRLKKAQELGYRLINRRAGSYGTVWTLDKGNETLTKDGFNAIDDPLFDKPVRETSGPGYDNMVSGQATYATKLAQWFATLPESTLRSASALATKINQTPIGEWASIQRDRNGDVRMDFRTEDGKLDLHMFSDGAYKDQVYRIVTLAGEAKNKGDREWFQVSGAAGERADSAMESDTDVRDLLNEYGFIEPESAPAPTHAPSAADLVPRQYNTMDDLDSTIKGLYDGTLSPDDYKAAFRGFVANKEVIAADLNKLTKDQLYRRIGKKYGGSETKPEAVSRAMDTIQETFALRRNYGSNSYTMGPGMYEKYKADKLAALTQLVEESTAADLREFADGIAKTRSARQEKLEGAKDPKTIEDFDIAVRLKKSEGLTFTEARMSLTPEQRAEYDRLKGMQSRDERKARADQQKTDVRVAATTAEGQIVETKHTRTGEDLFVVKAAERVERDVYNHWNVTAKRLGGWYSSFRGNGAVPGFQFKTRENADAFLAFIGGNAEQAQEAVQARRDAFADDKSQTAVERLNEMAERMEERADESLGRERKENTARRSRMAANAEAAANSEKAMATTMRRIAAAISDGTAQFLDRVRQKAQIEYLTSALRSAQYKELQAKYDSYGEQEKHKRDPVSAETADYAVFPQYTMMRSDLANLARQMIVLPNMKMLGQRVLKAADDTSDAYTKFAKEHLLEVSRFGSVERGGIANFSTLKDAERSIEFSKLGAIAVPLQIKRGEYRIILSPSEAINKGIWKGDDRLMTLDPDVGTEIVEKLGRLNRKTGRRGIDSPPAAPWQFENAYNDRKRLAGLGIEQPWEFRAALREFAGLKAAPKEIDKIKQLERAMAGRRNDGLDFFPTPANVAQDMIDAAEIKEGMSVLEPSAGMGHIVEQIRDVAGVDPDVVEMASDRRELLEAKGFKLVGSDFMDMNPREFFTFGDTFRAPDGTEGVMRGLGGMGSNRVRLVPDGDERTASYHDRDELTPIKKNGTDSGYDRILMNPPFSDRRDAEHVRHAYELLRPGGRLVALMGEGVFFGQDKKAVAFREWLDSVNGTSEKLAEGTFLDPSLPVNTGVNARMVVIERLAQEGKGNLYSKSARIVGDSGLGDVTITPVKGMNHIADILSAENAVQVSVKGGNSDVLRQIAKRFGKQIVFFRSSVEPVGLQNEGVRLQPGSTEIDANAGANGTSGGVQGKGRGTDGVITGFVNTGQPNIIFLRVDGGNHLLYILGHELNHSLKIDDRKLWALMAYQLQPLVRGFSQYRNEFGQEGHGEADALEELIGDVIGDNFLNQEFWNGMAKEAPTLFQKIARIAMRLINKALNISIEKDIARYVSDLTQARAIISKTMVEYADKASKGMYEKNASKLDREYITKRSVQDLRDGEMIPIANMHGKVPPNDGDVSTYGIQQSIPVTIGQPPVPPRNPTLSRAMDVFDNFTGSIHTFGSLKNVQTQLHKARKDPKHFGKVFSLAMDFRTDLSRSAYRAWEKAKDILPAYDDMASATKALMHGKQGSKELARASKWVFDGTTYGGGNPLAGMRWTPEQLKNNFNATGKEIAIYEQARESIDASLIEVANSIAWKIAKPHIGSAIKHNVIVDPEGARNELIEALGLVEQAAESKEDKAMIKETIASVNSVYEKATQLSDAGYAPLSRFGRYTVDVFEVDDNGKIARDSKGVAQRLEFQKFEFESEAKAEEKRLRKLYADRDDVAIVRGIQAEAKLFSGVDPETVTLFVEQIKDIPGLDIKKTVLDEWRREAISQRSAIMHNIKRKGIAGYSEDLPRVLATFLTSNARYASSNYHMADMLEAINDIPDTMGDVKDEASQLYDYISASNEPGAWMRGLMFAWYLGGSPAAAAVNLTQPVLMTLPYLSQFGAASKHLLSSAMQAMKPDRVPVGLRPILRRAMEEGVVEANEIHHLYDEGMKPILARLPGGESLRARAQGAATLWGAFFGMAENFNRRITLLAAYKMAQEMGQAKLKTKGFTDAYAFAKRAVEETQGVYAKENRPNWARGTGTFGAVGVAAFTFKQFSIQYVELVSRMYKSGHEGKKAALLMLGLMVLASGLQGLPGADDMDDLVDTILQSMGFRGNFKKAKRDAIKEAAGETIADIVMYGLSALTPIDVQTRLGLGNIIPATALFKPSEQGKAAQLAEILGPPGGMAKSVGDFIDSMQSGQSGSAFAALSPVFIRNIAKAVQMADTGEYKDTRGRKVENVGFGDALIKGIGFQPQEVASASRKAQMLRQDISQVKGVESDIAALWAQGVSENNRGEVERAKEMLRDWNSKNPETPIRINPGQIIRRVQEMRKERTGRLEKTAPRELRGYARVALL